MSYCHHKACATVKYPGAALRIFRERVNFGSKLRILLAYLWRHFIDQVHAEAEISATLTNSKLVTLKKSVKKQCMHEYYCL